MVSHHCIYQFVLCALIWLFIMFHHTRPKPGWMQMTALEEQIAERCVDILVDTGVFLCAAVYEPDR